MSARIFIVIVVFKRLELTRKCLASLRDQSYTNYEVIVVDHCEEDQSVFDYIRSEHPEFHVVKGTNDMWWTAATNFGIRHVLNNLSFDQSKDFILTLNNDLTVGNDYLEQLVTAYSTFGPNAMIGSVSLDADENENIDFAGCIWNQVSTRIRATHKPGTKYSEIQNEAYINSDLLPGRGVLFPIRLISEIGEYDEIKFPHYASDYDFSLRAKLKGYRLIVAPKAVVKSAVGETGARFDKNSKAKPSLAFFFRTQTSIKSPINISTRFNWAKKHARFPLVYFSIDSLKVVYSYLTYTFRFYKTRPR